MNTALDLPNLDPEIAEIVKAAMADIKSFFSQQIRRGQASGQLSIDIDPDMAAKGLLASSLPFG